MHQLFTAFAFLAVIVMPTVLAARASGTSFRRKKHTPPLNSKTK